MNSRRSSILAWAVIGLVLGFFVAAISVVSIKQQVENSDLTHLQVATILLSWWAMYGIPLAAVGALVGAGLPGLRGSYLARRRVTLAALFATFLGFTVLVSVFTSLGSVVLTWVLRGGGSTSNGIFVATGLIAALLAAILTSLADLTLHRIVADDEPRRDKAPPLAAQPSAQQ